MPGPPWPSSAPSSAPSSLCSSPASSPPRPPSTSSGANASRKRFPDDSFETLADEKRFRSEDPLSPVRRNTVTASELPGASSKKFAARSSPRSAPSNGWTPQCAFPANLSSLFKPAADASRGTKRTAEDDDEWWVLVGDFVVFALASAFPAAHRSRTDIFYLAWHRSLSLSPIPFKKQRANDDTSITSSYSVKDGHNPLTFLNDDTTSEFPSKNWPKINLTTQSRCDKAKTEHPNWPKINVPTPLRCGKANPKHPNSDFQASISGCNPPFNGVSALNGDIAVKDGIVASSTDDIKDCVDSKQHLSRLVKPTTETLENMESDETPAPIPVEAEPPVDPIAPPA
ncbi:hypothetical protein HDU96_003961, partial [Phlyctochytrium bullatum]